MQEKYDESIPLLFLAIFVVFTVVRCGNAFISVKAISRILSDEMYSFYAYLSMAYLYYFWLSL